MREVTVNNSLVLSELPVSADLLAELRSDHAGEYGAVAIYQGVLAVARAPALRHFAREHLTTEQRHLRFMEELLPPRQRTRLLPLWKVMGWSLGALPALFGPSAVFTTIAAVETFVEDHYQRQIDMMVNTPALADLRLTLQQFRDDEVHHKHDATDHRAGPPGTIAKLWSRIVGAGSEAAVVLAKRF